MTPSEYLESKGWRKINPGKPGGKYHNVWYWAHDDHQSSRRGFFTTMDAESHQRMVDKGHTCQCIPKVAPR